MASAKQYLLGSALVVGGVRLMLVFIRASTPPSYAMTPQAAEEISQRAAQKSEQRAQLAELLEASVLDLEDREKLDQARGDASRTLRELATAANAAGATSLGFEAFELEQSLSRDARKTCALGAAMKKLDAASAALSPAMRTPLEERLALVHRHVMRTCELVTARL
jgi:hypothetical protein